MIEAIHLFQFVHLHPVTSEAKVNCRVVRLNEERTRNPFSGSLLLSVRNQKAGAEEYRERVMGCNTTFLSIRFNARGGSFVWRQASGKGAGKLLIAIVDVAAEIDGAVLVHPCRQVGDVNRDGFRQIDHALLGRSNGGIDFRPRPALLRQQQGGEVKRVLNAHATMAEDPEILREQALGRCVVQIYIEAVGKHELDLAKSILAS